MRRTVTMLLVACFASLLLVGCGGASPALNGVASQSASQIVSAARSAAEGAQSVHLFGSISKAGASVTFNLMMVSGKGAEGRISFAGRTFQLLRVGDAAYIKGSASYYEQLGGQEVAKLLKGKWLKLSATSEEFKTFDAFTDQKRLIASALDKHGTLEKGSITTVDGQRAIAVQDKTRGGTLYVATEGKPYPIDIERGGSKAGKVTFDDWNKSVTLHPPPSSDVIDIQKLGEVFKLTSGSSSGGSARADVAHR